MQAATGAASPKAELHAVKEEKPAAAKSIAQDVTELIGEQQLARTRARQELAGSDPWIKCAMCDGFCTS